MRGHAYPAEQLWQTWALVTEYEPEAHCVIPTALVVDGQAYPAVQLVQLVAPASEYVPRTQTEGELSVVGHADPAGHNVQLVDPADDA